jgi:hypothetical protein
MRDRRDAVRATWLRALPVPPAVDCAVTRTNSTCRRSGSPFSNRAPSSSPWRRPRGRLPDPAEPLKTRAAGNRARSRLFVSDGDDVRVLEPADIRAIRPRCRDGGLRAAGAQARARHPDLPAEGQLDGIAPPIWRRIEVAAFMPRSAQNS